MNNADRYDIAAVAKQQGLGGVYAEPKPLAEAVPLVNKRLQECESRLRELGDQASRLRDHIAGPQIEKVSGQAGAANVPAPPASTLLTVERIETSIDRLAGLLAQLV